MKDLSPSRQGLERRNARFKDLGSKKFDLLVIGAGVHGALVSWIAAKLGYSVLVIDSADFGQGTSSRSSKLLHGGVRYLEQGNLALVYKSLKQRSAFMKMAPHLTRTLPFLFAVKPGQTAPAWMVQLGLAFYENIARFWTESAESNFDQFKQELKNLGLNASQLVPYHDAQINDVRFCIEAICEAEALGAKTFNYLEFTGARRKSDIWEIELIDKLSSEKLTVSADRIANLSGAAAKKNHLACFDCWPNSWPEITFSTGVHLFFDINLSSVGLILPAESKGRYYFVLPAYTPYRTGVLVGTTDRKIEEQDCYPKPTEAEIAQLKNLLKRDLPNFDFSSQFHAISGTRVLAGSAEQSYLLSRDEQILKREAYVTLIGGKYTTAQSTAIEILEKLFDHKYSEPQLILKGSSEKLEAKNTQLELNAAINRFGSNAKPVLRLEDKLEAIIDWQILYCLEREQAIFWEDIYSRRLNLDFISSKHEVQSMYQAAKTKFFS